MGILEEDHLLNKKERQAYHALLKLYGHEPHYFILEVKEDQNPMDMNDMQYVMIVRVQATHVGSQKSKTYVSRAGSGTWLSEFEDDLRSRYFEPE